MTNYNQSTSGMNPENEESVAKEELEPIPFELNAGELESEAPYEEISKKSLEFVEQDGLLPGEKYNEPDRPHWEDNYTCLLAMVGFCVGLSNIARFPYLCFKHGGLSFLIAYSFFVVGCAIPLMCLEVIVGQFAQSGLLQVWTRLIPILRGVGWIQCTLPLLICFYNNAFLTWTLHYCLLSLYSTVLPWIGCEHDWNTVDCERLGVVPYGRDVPVDVTQNHSRELRSGSEYFRGRVQRRWKSKYAGDNDNDSIHRISNNQFGLGMKQIGLGVPDSDMLLTLLAVYIIMYIFIYGGLRFKGKGIWFTVTAPYVVLLMLIFRGISLPGAGKGLRQLFYFTEHNKSLSNLLDPNTWVAAAEQLFFSLSTGGGIHLTLSSYNKFQSNVYRDAVACVLIDTGTSLLCSIIVFIALGSISVSDGSELKDLFAQGPDLLFEVCCDFWARLPGGDFFSCIFFAMVFFIGFESTMEALTCAKVALMEGVGDWFDRNGKIRWVFINSVLVLAYLIGTMSLTRGGLHVYLFLDTFTGGITYLMCSLFMVIGFGWIWGLQELCDAAEAMTGTRPNYYLQFSWKVFSPIVLTLATAQQIWHICTHVKALYQDGHSAIVFLPWIQTAGVIYAHLPIVFIPLGILVHMFGGEGLSWGKRFLIGLSPNYSHKEILETGTASRAKATHYLYFFARPSEIKPICTTKVHPAHTSLEQMDDREQKFGSIDSKRLLI